MGVRGLLISFSLLGLIRQVIARANDALGIADGFTSYHTDSFSVELVKQSETLASLVPTVNSDFNFQPNKTFLALRKFNGQHQTGDIIFRYRAHRQNKWITQDSAISRHPVTKVHSSDPIVLASSNLGPTLNKSLLDVVRKWGTKDGDLTLSFHLHNTQRYPIELGGLGFPFTSDNIFTNRSAVDINANCTLTDPNIGLNSGYLRFTRINGQGPAMVVTPLSDDSQFEGWGFLSEDIPGFDALAYQTQNFEGYYQWMPLTLAYAEEEWNATEPWNRPTSKVLDPDDSMTVGFRFTLASTIDEIENAVSGLGTPVAKGVPGYILPEDLAGKLYLSGAPKIHNTSTEPLDSVTVSQLSSDELLVSPRSGFSGRVRLTIEYTDGRKQTVHYYLTKSAPQALEDAGRFLNDRHWWTNTSDPFGRAPSFMCVDHSNGVGSLVLEDDLARVWLSGECHEAGASWYTMALKQIAQPNAEQIAKLEEFVDEVLWKTIQLPNCAVRQSIFWYDPNITDFWYNPKYPWWPETSTNYSVSWNEPTADVTSRSYEYTYPATTYWALYRAGRAFPSFLKRHSSEWYLTQAYRTLVYCFAEVNGTHPQPLWADGLMGETAYGELLKDLYREGWTSQAAEVESLMRARANVWNVTTIPFGSELGWDCTGEEGVFYWSNYFGDIATVNKTIQTILGYMPTVNHWGYNGNARRYWDFQFDAKLVRIERQINPYGSALNSLPLLGFYRAFPSLATHYIARVAYGGLFAPLSNIHPDGFGSTGFHSFPETLAWDNYSGDYGLAFAGLIFGSATYVRNDSTTGLQAFGGILDQTNDPMIYKVYPRDALRRRLYLESRQLFIEIDSGSITSAAVEYDCVTLRIGRSPVPGAARADECVIWLNQSFYVKDSDAGLLVSAPRVQRKRGGWAVDLKENETEVRIEIK